MNIGMKLFCCFLFYFILFLNKLDKAEVLPVCLHTKTFYAFLLIYIYIYVYLSNKKNAKILSSLILCQRLINSHYTKGMITILFLPLPCSHFIFHSFSLSAYGESLQKYTCCRHLRRRVRAVVPLIKPKEFESGNSPPLFLNRNQICLPLPH